MARGRNRLNVKTVESLKNVGKHSDGGGLYLSIDSSQRCRWIYLFNFLGKRREMGLGGYPQVSLRDARKARDEAEKLIIAGQDPIATRIFIRNKEAEKIPTFGEMANEVIASKECQWRNEKHKYQWRHTLTVYAAPLCNKPVNEITTIDVLAVLKPIWQSKNETASRLRGRIEIVLDAAKALKYRTGENPAAWKGNLAHLLPKRQKLSRGHQAALPYKEIPALLSELKGKPSNSALALEFTILTAARTNEILGAQKSEFDLEAKVWTIPAERMKMAKTHRVPLTDRCLEILRFLYPSEEDGFIFTGPSEKKQLSNMAMLMLLRRLNANITVHGFRSSFRDWAGNETHYPREVVEEALAHQVGDEFERPYRRSDALEKRRALMNDWAAYCLRLPSDNVIQLNRA